MILLFIIFIGVAAYLYLLKCYSYWEKRGVPFPKPNLFFGNAKSIMYGQKSMGQVCRDVYNDFKNDLYVGIYNMQKPAVVVRDMELITEILIKNFGKFSDNWADVERIFNPIFARNPFTAKGSEWKNLRSQLTPQFTSTKMKTLFPLIKNGCETMKNYIEMYNDAQRDKGVNIKELSEKFTCDNIASCTFGLQGNSFTDCPKFWQLSRKIMDANQITIIKQTIQLFCPFLRKLLMFRFFPNAPMNTFKDMVEDNLKYREENKVTTNDYFHFITELKHKTTSFEYTNDYLAGHAFTFFLDGYETSSAVLSFALYELAVNPDIQQKLKEEIDLVLDENGELTYETIQEISYLEKVVLETARKHPSLSFVSRICTEDYEFPPASGSPTDPNVTIEKGTPLFIPTMGVHYDPQYYPDPEKFDPSRFDNEEKHSRAKCTFLSFGEGPRICLGKPFAVLQIKAALATIVANYEIRLNAKTITPLEINMKVFFYFVKNDIWLNFHKRK